MAPNARRRWFYMTGDDHAMGAHYTELSVGATVIDKGGEWVSFGLSSQRGRWPKKRSATHTQQRSERRRLSSSRGSGAAAVAVVVVGGRRLSRGRGSARGLFASLPSLAHYCCCSWALLAHRYPPPLPAPPCCPSRGALCGRRCAWGARERRTERGGEREREDMR